MLRLAGRASLPAHAGLPSLRPHRAAGACLQVCGAVDQFVACGPGVERLAEEALELFPEARLELFTSDSLTNRDEASAAVERMIAGEIDILIGTQMVAKGHHFPNLTLVAVVDADLGLNGGDLRAAERTFQLLYQVAGRAGRDERPGRVLLQTHMPEHPVMQALVAGDRDRFVAAELADRAAAGMPPYGRLAALIVSGPDPAAVDGVCAALARRAPQQQGVTVLGPAPAPLALLRGRHRRRFLLKAAREIRRCNRCCMPGWGGSDCPVQSACRSTSIPIPSCDTIAR